jgi:hypothetical protein
MTRKRRSFAAAAGLVLFAWAAGASAMPAVSAASAQHTAPAAGTVRLVIGPFDHAGPGEHAGEDRDAAALAFLQVLRHRLGRSSSGIQVQRAGAGEFLPGTLLVDGEFTRLEAGREAHRRVFGFGSADVRVAVTLTVRDASTRRVITELSRLRSFRLGFMNGTNRDVLLRETRSLASDLADDVAAALLP